MLPIYLFHLIVVGSVLIWVFVRAKSQITPAVLFTICISYSFYCDFVVRGYDHPLIDELPWIDVVRYQATILLVYLAGIVYAWAQESQKKGGLRIHLFADEQPVSRFLQEGFGWFVVLLEITKRLYTTGWSFRAAFTASLQARGDNPWRTHENIVLHLVYFLLPLAGILFATRLAPANESASGRLRCLVGLVLTVLLIATYGSRTFTAIPIVYFVLRYLFSSTSSLNKVLVLGASSAVIVVLFSVLVLYRSEGFEKAFEHGEMASKGVVKYHQDDSYYRLLNSAYVSEHSRTSLDFGYFAYVLLVNPVPRYFWPDKPDLTPDYYGEYKQIWVTITFMGELISFFGLVWGSVLSVFMLMFFYHMISFGTRFLTWPLGTGLFMLFTLYVYQCMRSLLNFTESLYAVVGMLTFCYLVKVRNKQRQHHALSQQAVLQGA